MPFYVPNHQLTTFRVLYKAKLDRKVHTDIVANLMESSSMPAPKLDLSRFRYAPKRKLSSKSAPEASPSSLEPIKRPHITIEADEGPTKSVGPRNWRQVLANVKEMRKNFDAPVDSMGCSMCPEVTASPEVFRYQALISLMLSSQTRDHVTYKAMQNLQKHGCNVDNILVTSEKKLLELIYPVGFYKTKAKYIKRTTDILKGDYNGDIPKTVEELCKLPGVGPKMAHLCMKTAWDRVTGIGVDTHVHRISNRLGWVNTKTPEETRKSLESWLPKELWDQVGLLLVGFGQQVCQPVKPQCATCLNRELCPFGAGYSPKNK